jgi:flagellar L-ring protein FlgH
MRTALLALTLTLAASASAQDATAPTTTAAAPTTPGAAPAAPPAPLFRTMGSLYSAPTARRAGDVLTVILAERTNASRRAQYDAASTAGLNGSSGRGNSSPTDSTGGGGPFAVDARFTADASARNETALNDLLNGTVSVLVTGVDPAGNLQVEGERRISVNGVGHRLSVRGLVRPVDVSATNTVLSFQIANADVVYNRDGKTARFGPAFLGTVGLLGLILAGAFLGS